MIERLENMSVIVTGGASGIGLATAQLLARYRARVLVADLKEQAVAECVEQLKAEGASQVAGQACDVRSAGDCQQLVETAVARLGRIDALVHCAGILRPSGSRPRPLHELEDAEYEAVVDTNLKGTFLVNRAALRPMIAQRSGQIINLSSTSGRKGRPLDSVYSASKAGVIALSETIAEEVRAFGIRVQVLMPDAVDTPLWKQNGAVSAAPPQSLPPERVAELIAFCLALPPDTICDNLVIAPFRTRVGRRGGAAARSESNAT
jgi:NAD(P)-dependent dehydrogenase (short-subunit alcohol dehydrogenase family)